MDDLRPGFERWLRGREGMERAGVGAICPVEGGASNLTYRVELSDAAFAAVALRMQRESGIFQPYDVAREGQVIHALAGTGVPVPRVVGIEPTTGVLGAPFIVLEWVDAPHMGVAGPDADFGAFTRMVATIHAVDWHDDAFAILGEPASAAAATATEIAIVAARIDAFGVRQPLLDRGQALLEARIPRDGHLALCQGDINVFNFLFREREVVAVVDWEQARIGDPRSDVGQLISLSHLKGAPFGDAATMPFARAYTEASGRSLAGLGYFRALWAWQLAFIHRAWVQSNGSQPWYTWDEAEALLDRCLQEIA